MKSIVTDDMDYCFFCGRPAECNHHLIFGSSNRQKADEDGLIVPACNRCHNMGLTTMRIHDNVMAEKMSKILGQMAWEKQRISEGNTPQEAHTMFYRRYGKHYLAL